MTKTGGGVRTTRAAREGGRGGIEATDGGTYSGDGDIFRDGVGKIGGGGVVGEWRGGRGGEGRA